MSFNVVPKLSFTSALSVSASIYFNKPLLVHGALSVNSVEASENVDLLPIPGNLKKEILCMIVPVGEEIALWLKEFRNNLAGHSELNRLICWTPLGTIDYGRTATNCALSGKFLDIECFILVCNGSDPELIHQLWPVVKTRVLEQVAKKGLVIEDISKRVQFWSLFWAAYLTDQMGEFKRLNRLEPFADDEYNLFQLAVRYDNVGAARYFLGKIKNKCGLNRLILGLARECILLDRREFIPSIFLFLVSHLNEEQVKELLNYRKKECLIHFLKWPLPRFLLPMSEFVWSDFHFETDLEMLLQMVLLKIMQTPVPVVFENIFKGLWSKTPPCHQLEFFSGHTLNILYNLFNHCPLENVVRVLVQGNSNAYQKFLQEFIPNASFVISMSVEENKFKAFLNIFLQIFRREDLVISFESVYAKYTQVYIDAYYGNNLSSDETDSDF